jgi:chromosome segregation ATPase
MVENSPDFDLLRADVDALRSRFPKTADLYREACAIMFYRYGITPTTNALYQLVRKGSMSVPSEALRRFWSDLRRQSRVDVANAGLPEEVREFAVKFLGQVWTTARQAAEESVAHLKDAVSAERDALAMAKVQADAQMAELATRLEEASHTITTRDEDLVKLREQLSASHTTVHNLESLVAQARSQVKRLQDEALVTSRDHAADIDKVTARVTQAELRYVELEKRTLVELDRERAFVAKLQKSLESERQLAVTRYEKLQSDAQASQIQLARQEQAQTAQRAEISALTEARDAAIAQAAANREATVSLASQLAAEQARVEELRQQVRRLSEQSAARAQSAPELQQSPSPPRKRAAKPRNTKLP